MRSLGNTLPRGNTANPEENDCSQLEFGKAQILRKGKDIALFAIGLMVDIAEQTADLLEKNGYSVAVVNARFVKPLDEDVIVRLGTEVQLLVRLEENTIHGGFGSGVLETLSVSGICVPTLQLGVPDRFIAQGNPDEQLRSAELSMEQIYSRILERLPVPAHKKIRKKRIVSPKKLAS